MGAIQWTLLTASLILCGSPMLSGCGVTSRVKAFDTNQHTKANASVARTAIKEHKETDKLFDGVPPAEPRLSYQPYPDRLHRQAEELLVHEEEMGRLRRTQAMELEVIKHDMAKDTLRQKGRLHDVNNLLLDDYVRDKLAPLY